MSLSSLALLGLVLAAKGDPRIAVLDLKARSGVPDSLAQGITDSVVAEVRKQARKFSVISSDEIRSPLALEKQKQQLGCDSVSCLSEIGGALGAQQMVTGSLVLFGDLYVISLKRVDVSHASVIREASGRLAKGNERDLPDTLARLVETLFGEAQTAEGLPPPTAFLEEGGPPLAAPHDHSLGLALGIASAVTAVAAIASFVVVAAVYQPEFSTIQSGGNGTGFAQASGDRSTAQALVGVAITCGVAALATGTGAVLSW